MGPRASVETVTVALRCWHTARPSIASGGVYLGDLGLLTGIRVGSSDALESRLNDKLAVARYNNSGELDIAALEMLAAIIVLSLYLLHRTSREYLWFSISDALAAAAGVLDYESPGRFWSGIRIGFFGALFFFGSLLTYLLFYKDLLAARASWAFRLACAGAAGVSLFFYLAPLLGTLPGSWVAGLYTVSFQLYAFWILFLLLRRSREGVLDARLLLVREVLSVGLLEYTLFRDTLYWDFGRTLSASVDTPVLHTPFPISMQTIAAVAYLLALLGVIFFRFARTQREQDRIAAELEAARSLQHVLIPETLPLIPGLTIETAYYPVQEVGGDFFQVLPLASGDTLIVLGNVSGKGLPAAMTVSLIVGALRTLAETPDSPAAILAGLNRRLCGRDRGRGGGRTCLALRLSPLGSLTIANAGHLAPYRNGRELALQPELPLGLLPEAAFTEEAFALAADDRLMLITDGVPEAACRRGLFGFARTENLSNQPAAYLADAARSFGQSDNITVLTIQFCSQNLNPAAPLFLSPL